MVSFEPVDAREFAAIQSAIVANTYKVPCEAIAP
jgi:hypothetical protein